MNDLTVSSVELTVHVGDSALMGCVFRSTEEKRVTKVDWMFSSGKHIQVTRRRHCCVLEAPGQRCQKSVGEGGPGHPARGGGVAGAWALELVRTGSSPSLGSWLCNQPGTLLNLSELQLPHL